MVVPFQIYRHFKGNLYLVTSVALTSSELEPTVVYMSLSGDNQVWTRPLSEFQSFVPEGKENPTGQKYRFQQIVDFRSILSLSTTQSLIEELKKRPDSPFNELDIEGLNEKVVDRDYVVGELSYPYPEYPNKPYFNAVIIKETLEEAQKFMERNPHRCSSRTKIYKNILLEAQSFD